MMVPAKILQIGNYPPPMCGWAIQLKLVTEELRRRGHICEVLKINEGRQVKSPQYVDVQNGWDYLRKIWHFARCGHCLNVHVNGMSKKGYALAMAAVLVGRLLNRAALVTFHGGLGQSYFPRHDYSLPHWAFSALFRLAGSIACDSQPIQEQIVRYGIRTGKVQCIPTFSPQYVQFTPIALSEKISKFLMQHTHVILSYVSFRAEYRLDVLREAMKLHRTQHPGTGFVWLGFPNKEILLAKDYVGTWPTDEQDSLLLLGNLRHDEFLTLLSRCFLYLRTPACDGVAASVLEALALGIPVVASENGRRPIAVVTYRDDDAMDMAEKLHYVFEHFAEVQSRLDVEDSADNVGRMADWLTDSAPKISAKTLPSR
jgi:glycosyltransferase involved in cell wall biosynthesis